MPKSARFVIWFVCVIVFAYLPVWYTLIRDILNGNHERFLELVKAGDTLFISCAVMADGVGRTLLRLWQDRADKVPSSGTALGMLLCSVVVAIMCVVIYAAGRESTILLTPMFVMTALMVVVTTAASATIVLAVEV